MYWLAEQGMAPKRVFFAIISLIIFILTELLRNFKNHMENKNMRNCKNNTFDVLTATLNIVNGISGNVAGGALLSNASYSSSDLQERS